MNQPGRFVCAAAVICDKRTGRSQAHDACYGRDMRLHLVDGTYELYRAHYSPRPGHRDPSGKDAKATVGIVESMLALLHDSDEAVTHIAVAFDNPIRSFRNDLFLAYKSDEGVPPELRSQFDAAEDAVRAIGVTVWSMREYEADDGLATGARMFRHRVEQVRILTPDKDLGQCIQDDRVVQVDWDMTSSEVYPVAIKIEAWDRTGLLRDIATVVAERRVSMSAALISAVRTEGIYHGY